MKKAIVLIILSAWMGACATITPEQKEAASTIKVTDLSYLNGEGQKCQNLGAVAGDSVGAEGGQSSAIEHMKINALKVGANVVASNMVFTPAMGIIVAAESVKGLALACPTEQYAKVVSIEQLANR